MAAAFHVVGALVVGTAVAATVAGIVVVPTDQAMAVLAAAVMGALVWNLFTLWRGLPCSSGHCLVGALAGAALADGGFHAVNWGGLDGLRPVGVMGSLFWLFLSTAVAGPLALAGIRLARRALRRASRSVTGPVRGGEVAASAGLAFAHGSNDAQKTMGLMAAALVAGGRLSRFGVPLWVVLVSAGLLTLGTTLGGWRIVRTLGRRIYPLRPLDGLVSQGSAAGVVLVASVLGAPVSTTDVVAPSIVGVGTASAGTTYAGPSWGRSAWPGWSPSRCVRRWRRSSCPSGGGWREALVPARDARPAGPLGRQGEVTVAGMDALCAWTKGDLAKEAEVAGPRARGGPDPPELLRRSGTPSSPRSAPRTPTSSPSGSTAC